MQTFDISVKQMFWPGFMKIMPKMWPLNCYKPNVDGCMMDNAECKTDAGHSS